MIVHLLDGSEADSTGITFVPETYHFFLATADGKQLDITNDLDRITKRSLVPDFDDSKDDVRISTEGGTPHPSPGNDHGAQKGKKYDESGFWSNFLDGISSDLRALPGGATSVLIPLSIIVVGVALIVRTKK